MSTSEGSSTKHFGVGAFLDSTRIVTSFAKGAKRRKTERFALPVRSLRSSTVASVSPQTAAQQLEWRVRQYGIRHMAQLGLSPYWHEEIARRLDGYLIAALVRERMKNNVEMPRL